MKTKTAQRLACIDTAKESKGYTLHPAKFGLLEWLMAKRKNPILAGGNVELRHAAELCFAFTIPSAELCKIADNKLRELVDAFMHDLSPEDFAMIQKHAETELSKFQKTAVVPKKPLRPKIKQVPKK